MRRGDPTGSAGGLSGHRHHSVLSAGQLRIPDGGERQRPANALCAQRLGAAGGGGHRPCDGHHLGMDPRQACRAGVAGGGHPPDQGREAPGPGGQDLPPDGKALRLLRDVGRQELQAQPQALPLHGGRTVPQRDAVHLRFLLLRLSDGRRRPTGGQQHTGRAAVLQRGPAGGRDAGAAAGTAGRRRRRGIGLLHRRQLRRPALCQGGHGSGLLEGHRPGGRPQRRHVLPPG